MNSYVKTVATSVRRRHNLGIFLLRVSVIWHRENDRETRGMSSFIEYSNRSQVKYLMETLWLTHSRPWRFTNSQSFPNMSVLACRLPDITSFREAFLYANGNLDNMLIWTVFGQKEYNDTIVRILVNRAEKDQRRQALCHLYPAFRRQRLTVERAIFSGVCRLMILIFLPSQPQHRPAGRLAHHDRRNASQPAG